MKSNRKATIEEERLLEYLIQKSTIVLPIDWKSKLLVCNMKDGEMGSLYLFPDGKNVDDRKFGKQISEFQFFDRDGIPVIVSLNVDEDGKLFELDIWKSNYERLIKLPEV